MCVNNLPKTPAVPYTCASVTKQSHALCIIAGKITMGLASKQDNVYIHDVQPI